MADFHEYYSGSRIAPYLTIFIGGNHEASNHLFELYYGGWVAPNIYYLGAANVLRFGPLRIAGLTGIWKGYDYRKPHFERLPYNQEEITSIFHVRELDARKLLSLRSQVDIGLSHDWPQGVEYHGDYNWLFEKKPDFGTDSYAGKLGSVAARQCLDRLRPPYWFSAHLHTKFAAIFKHNQDQSSTEATPRPNRTNGRRGENSPPKQTSEDNQGNRMIATSEDRPLVSAWQQFHVGAQQADADERDKFLKDREDMRLEEKRTGNRPRPEYSFDETFNEVGQGDGPSRTIVSTTQRRVDNSDEYRSIPQLDGCSYSRSAKRQRLEDEQQVVTDGLNHNAADQTASRDQMDGSSGSLLLPPQSAVANPDAIDIDMSDDEDTTAVASDATPRAKPLPITDITSEASQNNGEKKLDVSKSLSEESEDGGVMLNPQASSFTPIPGISSLPAEGPALPSTGSRRSSGPALEHATEEPEPQSSAGTVAGETQAEQTQDHAANPTSQVSEEMRAQLAALSSKFTTNEPTEISPALPFPKEITNKTTHFLALGKCEMYQEFLQLVEIGSMTSPGEPIHRPLKLSYDPEWLAIQRVFAPELQLGGAPTDKVSPHRGETYYRERIEEEQDWVFEHVVEAGKLQVPENFTVTAPVYDPILQVGPSEMPREVTNPQTSAYCDLIGIENKFDNSEEEREFRMQQGPRPESESFREYQSRPRQQGRGGHRGGGDGGHGRGRGRGGGRGRGRGRGGGRGGGH
jgi:lariat debranching enzyme